MIPQKFQHQNANTSGLNYLMLREPQMKQQKESTASNFMSVNGPQHTKITASTTLSTF